MTPSFSAFTYIFPLLVEKDICDCRNVSITDPCVYCAFHVTPSISVFTDIYPRLTEKSYM
jgi:hypothetical protein